MNQTSPPKPHRKIIHIDMDAFYASVEQRDNPALKGKAIAVGGSPEGRGGVVATCSYEARKYGVRSAMPAKKARELCPGIIFIPPRFDVYKAVSRQVREIFHRYTDLIEPLSLDEAYLDVTEDKQGIGSAIDIATLIKKAIKDELQLTASAGVSINKFVAKIASDMQKPDGLTFIGPSKVEAFVEALQVEKFYGVGKVTAEKMKGLNIYTGADVKKLSEAELIRHFGKAGRFYYQIVRGIDQRPVEANQETKSIGAEDTFAEDLTRVEDMHTELDKLALIVNRRVLEHGLKGRTITLKIKYSDFRIITRSKSFTEPLHDPVTLASTAKELLLSTELEGAKIRLLGITLSNFGERATAKQLPTGQLPLFNT
ncbi:MAG: DNA polymerase IV [Chitinophagaceae bacterium]|nr:MAG: DNA polymerase IV [Chitinophagaceae bacterium]